MSRPNMQHFLKNINLLNVLLIAAILIFVNYSILPLLDMNVRFTLPAGMKHPDHKTGKANEESTAPSLTDYTLIADENLFHPERKIPPEKKEEQPVPKPDFVLYGTLITDDVSIAYLEDLKAPVTTPGRGKRQTALKIGDTMGGFTLKEVEADRVTMVRREESVIVPLNDPAHPKERKESGITASVQTQTQVKVVPPKRTGAVSSRSRTDNSLKKSVMPPVRTDIKKNKVQLPKDYRPSGKGGALLFGTKK